MKSLFYVLVGVIVCFGLLGCSRSDSNWYQIEGGYVNLSRVKHITTRMEMTLRVKEMKDVQNPDRETEVNLKEASITKENIKNFKAKIEQYGSKIVHVNYKASVVIDGLSIQLQELKDFKRWQDLINLVDAWEFQVDKLFDQL